jgi:hypothetical protein
LNAALLWLRPRNLPHRSAFSETPPERKPCQRTSDLRRRSSPSWTAGSPKRNREADCPPGAPHPRRPRHLRGARAFEQDEERPAGSARAPETLAAQSSNEKPLSAPARRQRRTHRDRCPVGPAHTGYEPGALSVRHVLPVRVLQGFAEPLANHRPRRASSRAASRAPRRAPHHACRCSVRLNESGAFASDRPIRAPCLSARQGSRRRSVSRGSRSPWRTGSSHLWTIIPRWFWTIGRNQAGLLSVFHAFISDQPPAQLLGVAVGHVLSPDTGHDAEIEAATGCSICAVKSWSLDRRSKCAIVARPNHP